MNISGSEKLIEVFGRWPSFHDAEVLRLQFDCAPVNKDCGPTVECTIHVWEMTSEVDEKGYFVLKNHVLVTFRFIEVSESEFNGFNQQNVLSTLSIEDISNQQVERIKYEVQFPSLYGLSGFLKCLDIQITQVVECNSEGNTQ